MKYLIFSWLLLWSITAQATPELIYMVPNETVEISGAVVKPNQALKIVNIDNVTGRSVRSFEEFDMFPLPDGVKIIGLSRVKDPSRWSFVLSSALSHPGGSPPASRAGDVLLCASFEFCLPMFSAQDNLGLNANIQVDAIEWELGLDGENDLLVSFNMDFEYDGVVYDHNNTYRIDYPQNGDPISGFVDSSGYDFNIQNNMNMTAYSSYDADDRFLFYVSDTVFSRETGAVIFPSEFFEFSSSSVTNSFINEFKLAARGISAMTMADTGWVQWNDSGSVYEVYENEGSIAIPISRINGAEYNTSFVITAVDGSAVSGIDFQLNDTLKNWANGESGEKFVTLDVLNNQVQDGTRELELVVSANTGYEFSLVALNQTNRVTVMIRDDDSDLIFYDGFQ